MSVAEVLGLTMKQNVLFRLWFEVWCFFKEMWSHCCCGLGRRLRWLALTLFKVVRRTSSFCPVFVLTNIRASASWTTHDVWMSPSLEPGRSLWWRGEMCYFWLALMVWGDVLFLTHTHGLGRYVISDSHSWPGEMRYFWLALMAWGNALFLTCTHGVGRCIISDSHSWPGEMRYFWLALMAWGDALFLTHTHGLGRCVITDSHSWPGEMCYFWLTLMAWGGLLFLTHTHGLGRCVISDSHSSS